MTFSEFIPFPFLKGAHRQTFAGWLSKRHRPMQGTRVEKISLDQDSDFTTLHYHEPEAVRPEAPTLVLIHGLEGNANRPYMIRIAGKAAGRGWRTARMNMRCCGDAEGVSTHFYNSTHSGDVRQVCEWLHSKNPESPICVAGFSLGGNLALKMAGEGGCKGLAKVVAVSPPIALHRSSQAIRQGKNRAYEHMFVKSLVQRARNYLTKISGPFSGTLSDKMSLVDFDTVFTVPLGGFASLQHYYEEGSPKRLLGDVQHPTLIITAQDDPLVPFESFQEIATRVRLVSPRHGGHLGFVGFPRNGDPDYRWAENRMLEFFANTQPQPA